MRFETTIQGIGLGGNLQENPIPSYTYISWENQWFPVKILPTQPVHWDQASNPSIMGQRKASPGVRQKSCSITMYNSTIFTAQKIDLVGLGLQIL